MFLNIGTYLCSLKPSNKKILKKISTNCKSQVARTRFLAQRLYVVLKRTRDSGTRTSRNLIKINTRKAQFLYVHLSNQTKNLPFYSLVRHNNRIEGAALSVCKRAQSASGDAGPRALGISSK